MLAADNNARLCSRCHRDQHDLLDTPPQLSNESFETDEFRAAFESQHIGKVFKAYRNHPYFLQLLGKALSQETLGRWLGLSQGAVSKLETLKPEQNFDVLQHFAITLCLPPYMLWFDLPGQSRLKLPQSVLWLAGASQPGLALEPDAGRWVEPAPAGRSEREPTTNRRELVSWGSAVVAGAFAESLWSEPDRMYSALDRGSVGRARLNELRRDATDLGVRVVQVPPATLLDEVLAQFRNVRQLVSEKQSLAAQRELTVCGAMFATVLGEILFVEGAFPLAAHWYGIARRSAEEAGDQYLADIALAGSTYLPTYRSDPRAVLANVSSRLETSHAPSPAIAWLWGFRAKAHAMLGEADAFQQAIERARQALEGSAPDLIRPGIFSFLPEKLAFYEARGWVELNDADAAATAADHALSRYDFTETTEPALARFEQASAYAQAGELAEACRIAMTAMVDRRTYYGITVVARAHEFDRLLGPSTCESVRDWRDVLASLRKPQFALPAAPGEDA